MIRLRQLLQEFEVGKHLWADEDIYKSARSKQAKFLQALYHGAWEPNTPEELAAWREIYYYVMTSKKSPNFIKILDDLLALKSKFPKILDPELSPKTKLYRGMTLDAERIVELLYASNSVTKATGWQNFDDVLGGTVIRIAIDRRFIRSRSAKFLSMSTEYTVAKNFARWPMTRAGMMDGSRWPLIAEINYSDIEALALMNPKFMNTFSVLDEEEIWVVADAVPITALYITDPRSIDAPTEYNEAQRMIANALNRKNPH